MIGAGHLGLEMADVRVDDRQRCLGHDGVYAAGDCADPDADEVCRRVRVITHAKSLGGVELLIERRAPGLLRLSVGCEHVEDLSDDLKQAL